MSHLTVEGATDGVPLPVSLNATPNGGTAISAASGNVANSAAVSTLPAVALKTNYLTSFTITSAGATSASVVLATITGLLGGTQTFVVPVIAGANLANAPIVMTFDTPLPASAVNTAIVVTLPALGTGNTNAATTATGYVL